MRVTDFLTIRDFTSDELRHLLDLARDIKADPARFSDALKGKTLAMIFEKPSLRTRVTFDVGIQQLGGFSVYLSPAEINLGKRESVYDVAKNLERMVQGIMIRTFAHDIVEQMAECASIPVINGLTDFSHPCQAHGRLPDDPRAQGPARGPEGGLRRRRQQRVALADVRRRRASAPTSRIGTPAGYEPKADVVGVDARRGRRGPGRRCSITERPGRGRGGRRRGLHRRLGQHGPGGRGATRASWCSAPYQVNEALFAQAKPDAIFMHCLPAHRGEEVTDEVIDSPHSVVFQEAENRLHAQKAIMLELMR